MSEAEPTWILLVRDVASSVRVQNQPSLLACLILDADTGLIRGVAMEATAHEACAAAARSALTLPAGTLPPRPPAAVQYDPTFAEEILGALDATLPDLPVARRVPSPPPAGAEDIFDSLLGHLSGRGQTLDWPEPEDWELLYAQAATYSRAAPWELWSDGDPLDLVVDIAQDHAQYVAVVLGQEGIQHGLALYPGTALPDQLATWRPGEPVPTPEGSLVLWLDDPADAPAELRAKAVRYGWPADDPRVPLMAVLNADGLVDLDRRAAHHLTLALAAVVAHQGPRSAPTTSTDLLLGDEQQVGSSTIG